MFKNIYRLKQWNDLKRGKVKLTPFKSIIIQNCDKDRVDELINELKLDLSKLHITKKSNYILPDKIEPSDLNATIPGSSSTSFGSISIMVYIEWTIYFFNESDWIAIQIVR